MVKPADAKMFVQRQVPTYELILKPGFVPPSLPFRVDVDGIPKGVYRGSFVENADGTTRATIHRIEHDYSWDDAAELPPDALQDWDKGDK